MTQTTAPAAEPLINLALPLSAVDTILAGLGELQVKRVGDLVHYVRGQAIQQLQAMKQAEGAGAAQAANALPE